MTEPNRDETVTGEVGSEGGTHGELEIGRSGTIGVGSEAGETWSPAHTDSTEVRRDETGEGKRSPTE